MDSCENKKRAREDSEDSDVDSPESKLIRVDSDGSKVILCESGITRVDSENSDANSQAPSLTEVDSGESADSVLDSPEAKQIHDDLLDILDDPDSVTDRDPAIQGLDSVIKSFAEEIQVPEPEPGSEPVPAGIEMRSESGESQPVLGYLLEASDDELGLPPTTCSGEKAKIEAIDFEKSCSETVGLDGMLGFEDEVPSYDPYVFGVGTETNCNGVNGIDEYVALDGLFDYSDGSFETGGVSEVAWRTTESLSAL
ncbi:uncharacterized protein LOC107418840 [Ziziphus jujuba]|uniref:Uncharacterized protein LOC107418840 n=2 Tax=Ziziphus jujuba TaxID=326968 RepID=A0A6P4A4M5_ZIZJJ|nr:uncharacterized protein LOC107418840 [Ziziphus jujuba]KAH7528757.1 hypothetical protein FEM48_Zijuj05G0106100 [Ziziphus jujuba var. spinosa]